MNMQKRPPVRTAGAGELDLLGKSGPENSPEESQDQEQHSAPVAGPESSESASVTERVETEFTWRSDEDIVVHYQPRTAVYFNSRGQTVIRQQADPYDEEDTIAIISAEHLPAVIRALADQITIPAVWDDINAALLRNDL